MMINDDARAIPKKEAEEKLATVPKRTYIKKTVAGEKKAQILAAHAAAGNWKELARTIGVPLPTAYRWLHQGADKSDSRGGARKYKITQEHKNFMANLIKNYSRVTLQDIVNKLAEKYDVHVTKECIRKHLDSMTFTLKEAPYEPEAANNNKAEWKDCALLEFQSQSLPVLYMDETNFNLVPRKEDRSKNELRPDSYSKGTKMSSQSNCSTHDSTKSTQLACLPLLLSNVMPEKETARWTPSYLASIARDIKFNCRLQCRNCFEKAGAIQWEGDCYHVMASVDELLSWIKGRTNDGNEDEDEYSSLASYDPKIFWCYLDYKNLDSFVQEKAAVNKAIDWSCFGLVEEEPFQNYVWLGTQGAHTPCHYDTYGFNLVAQLYGSKQWILFPPEDSENLYPTRIPYEESSVYSEVNIKNPDLDKHPKFKNCRPHVIILKAGQVLYVPWKWWHFAECLETSLSINTWLELPEDKSSRVEESITRMIFSKWMTFNRNTDHWLNPNEDVESDEINAGYLSQTLHSLHEQSQSTEGSSETGNEKLTDGSVFVKSSSTGSKPKHLENFLTFVEKVLETSSLGIVGKESSCTVPGPSASNLKLLTEQPMQPLFCPSTSDHRKDFVQEPDDDCIKKRRLTNVSEEHANITDVYPCVEQLSAVSVDKLLEHLGYPGNGRQQTCSHYPQGKSLLEKRPHRAPLNGEFVEEELLKILLEPDIVALSAQKLLKRYTQKVTEHSQNK